MSNCRASAMMGKMIARVRVHLRVRIVCTILLISYDGVVTSYAKEGCNTSPFFGGRSNLFRQLTCSFITNNAGMCSCPNLNLFCYE